MGKAFLKNTADLLQKKHKRKQWQKIMISLSLVVALLTSCLLIHPAITMSRQATCGQEEHTHTEKCYEKKLICNKEEQSISESSETEGEESVEAHTHSDACYENVLICGKQEHTHSEACYPKEEEKKEEVAANTEEEDVKSEDQEDKAEEKTEDTEKAEARTLKVDQADYTVEVDCPAEANIPKDAKLKVREIKKDSDEYQDYYEKAMKAVASGDETDISFARFFDISFEVDGKEIEPEANVEVKITYDDKVEVPEKGKVKSVHFGNKTEVLDVKTNEKNGKMDEVKFNADSFSVYAIVGTESISSNYITADGDTYTITVTYGPEAEIPEGATLEVSELANDNKDYRDYIEKAAKALAEGEELPFVNAARLFDISIMADGKKVEPKAPVEVKIEYANAENLNETSEVGAIHFKESTFKTETEVMDVDVQGEEGKVDGVTFTTDSFSIYAVVIIDKEAGTFIVEDEDYKVTITYTKEANIPIGTELTVKEITPEEDHYWELRESTLEKINEGLEWEDTELTPDPRKGITDAVFFDISLVNGGKEIEPDVPLQVKIEYKNDLGILVPDEEKTEIIHFGKSDTETIEDVDVEYSEGTEEGTKVAVSYEYLQESFSEVGSYSTGKYIEINDSNIINPSAGIMAAPILRAAGDSSITAEKTITDADKDGVYDLTLSVTGQSESSSSTSVTKSNVVIVVDVSGSMTQNKTYSKYTGAGTSSGTYYGRINNSYQKVYWRNPGKGYRWQYLSGGRYYDYSGDVYFLETRLAATKRALKELVSALLANNKDEIKDGVSLNDIVEITLVKFAYAKENTQKKYNGTSTLIGNVNTDAEKTQIDTIIDNLWAGGGTNWERALAVAKTEADTYKRNQPDEAVSVIFMTDGVPTSWGTTNTEGTENAINTHGAWNEADDDARAIVSAGYTLYDIFAFGTDTKKYDDDEKRTDADYLRSLTNYAYSGSGTYKNTTLSNAAKPYFFNASDTSALQDAFNAIINSISGNVGYGGVMVDDGVTTGVTSTSVTVDGTVNTDKFKYSIKNGSTTLATVQINGNNATFTIDGTDYPATGETVTTVINGTTHTNTVFSVTVGDKTYKMSPASFDNNGKIQWDLAGIGIIENGYTYKMSFEVWPNQLAYDMVADLNNGVKTLGEIKADVIASKGDAVWNQIEQALVSLGNGKYAIRTNYEQYVDYYTVDTQTNEQTGETTTTYTEQPRKELGPKDPVDLTSSSMDLKKIWEGSLDESQLKSILWEDSDSDNPSKPTKYGVTLRVWKADTLDELNNLVTSNTEGTYYLKKTLGWDDTNKEYIWTDTVDVAPGTMVTLSKARDEMGLAIDDNKIVTYNETDYYILESGHYYTVSEENINSHFELNTIVYHPMLVNGVLSNVTFNADGSVESIVPMVTIEATNTLKGNIKVQKEVYDDSDNKITTSDDTFSITVTMKKANGDNYLDWDYYISYGDNNPNKTDTITRSEKSTVGNTNTKTFDLYIGDVVHISDVPAGVRYTVSEDTSKLSGTDYENESIKYEILEGASSNFKSAIKNDDGSYTVKGNSSNRVTVINKVVSANIKLKKIGDSDVDNLLDGVQFKLYYDKDCTKQVTKDSLGNDIGNNIIENGEIIHKAVLTTGVDGTVDIGRLISGTYYLQEITTKNGYNLLSEIISITVDKDGKSKVSYDQPSYAPSTNNNGVTFNNDIYTITINNSSGVSLPSTGGSGTLPYTLSGSLLAAIALMYGFVLRRRRERRLR
ncbi:SpaA isopeptide-forming pilin-related protein [Lachnospiraceae bacterium SGI.231]